MKFYVTVCRLQSKSKMGEVVRDFLYNKYNRSIITHEQLKEIPAEIERMMNNLIVQNPRLKMLNMSIHGSTDDGRRVELDACEREGTSFQISVHGTPKGWTDQTAVRLNVSLVISDYSNEENGGES